MWMLLPVISLAMVHLSGNNMGLIPDMAGVLGDDSYLTNIILYIILGGGIATLTAWIGVTSGLDLVSITKNIYGPPGKKILAISLLATSIPASALTGGYYAGGIIQLLLGIPYWISVLICLLLFSLFTVQFNHELLKLSNYVALLLIPILIFMIFSHNYQCTPFVLNWNHVNWLVVLGLIGYNVGGMWLVLIVEVAAYLAPRGNKGITLVILAKVVEGIVTFCLAYLVLSVGIHGPLAVATLVSNKSAVGVTYLFYIVLFCTFGNAMAPAMLVNVRQISSLTGLSFRPALLLATSLVYGLSFLKFSIILLIMGYTTVIMILFIIYTAYFLHKYGINQQ